MSKEINNVPTNIVSGFLGVGKTTAILNLFEKKPVAQKWAVLVNEFGKVGIDGRIYQAKGIAVKEIPGGCMCCAQGLPLQVAINRLLKATRPDRLIIESSGVGHPAGVLKTLSGDGFKNVLTLKAGICLIDPEYLLNPVYQNNELFNEQIQYADVLVANKMDLASMEAKIVFEKLLKAFEPAKAFGSMTTNAEIELDWLDYNHQTHHQKTVFKSVLSGQSINWQTHTFHYTKNVLFDIGALEHHIKTVKLIRLKGVIQTAVGFYLLNYSAGRLNVSSIESQSDSYIEMIDEELNIPLLESILLKCILNE